MTGALSWDLQKSIYASLAGDAALTGLIGDPPRLYDGPPPSAVFPYVLLGQTRVKAWPGVDGGLDHDLRIHVFSRYAGRREVKEILNAIYDALHERDLTGDDFRLVQMRFVFADIFQRSDNGVFQGVSRFRALTEPAGA